ncbi:MAG TPA: AAA family ATPase [Candidatus Sulfotelmatobacter sp.]|nr:AAA family ATPase [Candidatus Sulfotelmatobacter sp.]
MPIVLGVTGPNAAGKGEVSAILSGMGFAIHSLSDIVREEALGRGLPPEREHLIRVGTELRERYGPGVLAERLLPRLGGRDVVDSIRNPAEVEVLRRVAGFSLLGVRAPAEVRYERSRRRARPGDPASFEEFLSRERQENSLNPAGQQLQATFDLADRIIENDGDLGALRAQVVALVK